MSREETERYKLGWNGCGDCSQHSHVFSLSCDVPQLYGQGFPYICPCNFLKQYLIPRTEIRNCSHIRYSHSLHNHHSHSHNLHHSSYSHSYNHHTHILHLNNYSHNGHSRPRHYGHDYDRCHHNNCNHNKIYMLDNRHHQCSSKYNGFCPLTSRCNCSFCLLFSFCPPLPAVGCRYS